MATIGQQLISPELGWKRYDDIDSRIKYIGNGWSDYTGFSSKTGVSTKSNNMTSANTYIEFSFIGSKIRTYGAGYVAMNTGNSIIIDGVSYNMALWGQLPSNTIGLSFEKSDLSYGRHIVKIVYNNSSRIYLDAIDIDDTGYLIDPNIRKYIIKKDCIPEYINISGGITRFNNDILDSTQFYMNGRISPTDYINKIPTPFKIMKLKF